MILKKSDGIQKIKIQSETNMILKKQQVHSDVAENHGDETLNADTAGSLKRMRPGQNSGILQTWNNDTGE